MYHHKSNLREPNLLYLVGSAILCRFRKSESFRLYPVQKCIVSKNARGRVKEGGPLQTRFLGVFKFKNELFHWIRLNLLMEFEGLFVKFGPRVPLFWANLGYFGSILAIFNMVQFLSRWNFLNEFCCKFLIFVYPFDTCIIMLSYNAPLWLLTPPNMLKNDNFWPISTFLDAPRAITVHYKTS